MYLNLLILPLLSVLIVSLLGRYIGNKGLLRLLIIIFFLITSIVLLLLYENYLNGTILKINLWNSINNDLLNVNWYFYLDDLSQLMLFVVISITFIVLIYSYDYMISDPHIIRFYFFILLFVFFMIILITTNSLPILFIGWEGVGLSSFLLISFWFTRFQAQLGALLALLMNRVGDIFFLIGLFLSLAWLGSFDLISISTESNINWDYILITFFIAAMAKSAQIYLHLWLPYSMEGSNIYHFSNLQDEKGRFKKKYNAIKDNRDNDITQYQKEAIIGLLLSDGYIKGKILSFTFKTDHLEFIKWLKFNIFGSICSLTLPNGYPKINPTQYTFNTLSFNYLEELRLKWYPLAVEPKKSIPSNLYKDFTSVSLAFMIMGDGYWYNSNKTIIICTEYFTLKDIHILLYILRHKFGLVVSTIKRGNGYRLRFSSREKNIRLLRSLIINHFHPIMHYKLGISPMKKRH